LNRTFAGENAKNRDFSGGEKLKTAAVYQPRVNHGAARMEIDALFTGLAPGRASKTSMGRPKWSVCILSRIQ
jgi:hypothetical protein